jgi:hypothetical protein
MNVPSVGKEEPNIKKHSTIRHERSFCDCTVFCEIRFLFTYRRNTHVLLYCGLWSSVPLYPQKEHSCLIVLCFVMFDKTQYNKTWAFLLLVKRNRTSQNTVQYDMSVHSVGKEKPNFTNHSTIRHEPSFTHRRNTHVLLYCVLWCSVPLYLQKKSSCLIVLCLLKFGSSLPTEGTIRHERFYCE